MLSNEACIIIIAVISLYTGYKIFDRILFPIMVNKLTKYVEMNPEWITPKLRKEYYGFYDIDIILVNDPLGCVPRFKKTKDKRFQLLISEDTSVKDIEDVGRLALATKIKIEYGLWFPEKPLHWLSILCYMLDGGDIKQESTRWEEVEKDKKPIDGI